VGTGAPCTSGLSRCPADLSPSSPSRTADWSIGQDASLQATVLRRGPPGMVSASSGMVSASYGDGGQIMVTKNAWEAISRFHSLTQNGGKPCIDEPLS
jgi:hypothetical protein